jgi:hypothetical protein
MKHRPVPLDEPGLGCEDWIEERCGAAVPHREVGIEFDLLGEYTIRNRPLARRGGHGRRKVVCGPRLEQEGDHITQPFELKGRKLAHEDDVDQVPRARARLVVAVATSESVQLLSDLPLERDGRNFDRVDAGEGQKIGCRKRVVLTDRV